MAYINKKDTNGIKPLLQEGEFGYDKYPAGGDVGRVWVGTGTANIAQARKDEVDAVKTTANTHIARTDNPHATTKAQVGLGNVDNTSDADKPVSTAQQSALNGKADKATTYTKTELDSGQLDNRYYTETEIDTKLAEQDDASEINYDGTVSGLVATNAQDAIDEVEDRLDIVEGVVVDVNLTRADKYLASQDIANMVYTNGDLTKIQYRNATDVDYEVFTYSGADPSEIAHYVGGILKGNSVLLYTDGDLSSVIFTEV